MELTIYTDGGSLSNPGQAAYGFVIYREGEVIVRQSERIGVASNNVAEYTALIKALEKVKAILQGSNIPKITRIHVFSDSQLMVSQVNGIYKVKHADMREKIMQVRILESELNIPIIYTHVLREKNQLADSLVKEALGQ